MQLARNGRFSRVRNPHAWVAKALHEWPLQEAALTWRIAQEAGDFEMLHSDPADRLIVATARVLKCKLVTEDQDIIDSDVVDTIAND